MTFDVWCYPKHKSMSLRPNTCHACCKYCGNSNIRFNKIIFVNKTLKGPGRFNRDHS